VAGLQEQVEMNCTQVEERKLEENHADTGPKKDSEGGKPNRDPRGRGVGREEGHEALIPRVTRVLNGRRASSLAEIRE